MPTAAPTGSNPTDPQRLNDYTLNQNQIRGTRNRREISPPLAEEDDLEDRGRL